MLDDDEIDHCESFAIPTRDIAFGEEVGIGGSCTVLRGQWRQLQVAVKTWPAGSDPTSIRVKDTIKEMVVLAKGLKHPNIVGVYGICTDTCSDLPLRAIAWTAHG